MGDGNDLRWLQSTANELNNLLQVISESSKALRPLCAANTEALRYYAFLANGLERARTVTSEMAARLGGLSDPAAYLPSGTVATKPELATTHNLDSRAAELIQNPDGEGELVMLIDDEKVVLDLASTVLISEGYRVLPVTDVFKSLSLFEALKDEISLVILDYTMPIMDGSEVFEELKKISPDAPIMLSSGFAEHEKVRNMLTRGLRGFLPKPYTKQKLLSQVRSTLDAIRGERRVL
jgi:CheY-like chemotaxis protein